MTSWEQKGCSSWFLCVQPPPGRPWLCQTRYSSEHSGSAALFQDWTLSSSCSQMDAVMKFFHFFCFPVPKPHLLLTVSLPKAHVLGSSAAVSCSCFLASAQQLRFTRWVSHHCCLPPSFSFWHTNAVSLFWSSPGSLAFCLAEVSCCHLYDVRWGHHTVQHSALLPVCQHSLPPAGSGVPGQPCWVLLQHPSSPAIRHFSLHLGHVLCPGFICLLFFQVFIWKQSPSLYWRNSPTKPTNQ